MNKNSAHPIRASTDPTTAKGTDSATRDRGEISRLMQRTAKKLAPANTRNQAATLAGPRQGRFQIEMSGPGLFMVQGQRFDVEPNRSRRLFITTITVLPS